MSDSRTLEAGARIKLLRTTDPFTDLDTGDMGTVTDVTWTHDDRKKVWVDWDDGGHLALIGGEDKWKVTTNA